MHLIVRSSLLVSLLAVAPSALAGFADVSSDHSNRDAIEYMQEHGMVEGYADGTFRPDTTINRAEFVKIITLALYGQTMIDQCGTFYPFIDTPRDAWYVKYVCRARDGWLLTGYPDNTFRPSQNINFSEAAKILANAYGLIHRDDHCGGKLCPDVDTAEHPWYEQYVRALGDKNAIPLSISRLDHAVTRGEMSEMVYRLVEQITDVTSMRYQDFLHGTNSSAAGPIVENKQEITLYFTDSTVSEPDCSEVQTVTRTIPKTPTVADAALRQLFAGVTAQEKARGLSSDQFDDRDGNGSLLPQGSLGSLYEGISIVDGVATVRFKKNAMDHFSQGLCNMTSVMVPITRTLGQFKSIQYVKYSFGGEIECEFGYFSCDDTSQGFPVR